MFQLPFLIAMTTTSALCTLHEAALAAPVPISEIALAIRMAPVLVVSIDDGTLNQLAAASRTLMAGRNKHEGIQSFDPKAPEMLHQNYQEVQSFQRVILLVPQDIRLGRRLQKQFLIRLHEFDIQGTLN